MALFEYIAPMDIGAFFAGIGLFMVLCVFAYFIYVYARYVRLMLEKDIKYNILEEAYINKYAKEKNIDLDKEIIKRDIFTHKKKSLRRTIQERMYEDMFGKNKKSLSEKEASK